MSEAVSVSGVAASRASQSEPGSQSQLTPIVRRLLRQPGAVAGGVMASLFWRGWQCSFSKEFGFVGHGNHASIAFREAAAQV